MEGPILITGATGNVGRAVVATVRARGSAVRIAQRRPSGDEPAIPLDFHDAATFAPAVAGCRSLFLLRPPAIADTKNTLNVLIDAARAAGVERIVFLSVAGAGDSRLVPHHAVEQHLRAGPKDWTILRPGFFAQNLVSAYRNDIKNDDRIYLPAGDGRAAFVDTRDIGEVAARALLEPAEHAGRTYTLTGPVACSFDEVAKMLSDSVGRPIRYEKASVWGYWRHLRRAKFGRMQTLVQTLLHVGLRFGQAETVDPTLESLLGRRPRDVAGFIRDYRASFL